jgi:hypothetical protein
LEAEPGHHVGDTCVGRRNTIVGWLPSSYLRKAGLIAPVDHPVAGGRAVVEIYEAPPADLTDDRFCQQWSCPRTIVGCKTDRCSRCPQWSCRQTSRKPRPERYSSRPRAISARFETLEKFRDVSREVECNKLRGAKVLGDLP